MGNSPFGDKEGEEWNSLQKEDKEKYAQENFTNALASDNVEKNRYNSILAPDHTRVKIQQKTGSLPQTDYINANYVDGIHEYSKHAYIATQAPKQDTIQDFWKMIWEQNVYVIVMLTNLTENGKPKASQYWPVQGSKTYGNITVTLVENPYECEDWCTRKFAVKMGTTNLMKNTVGLQHNNSKLIGVDIPNSPKNEKEDVRMIVQFHYTSWPDMGVPDIEPMVNFMFSVEQFYDEVLQKFPDKSDDDLNVSPIVVHCSAGVGRTGVFCVVHSMVKKYQGKKGKIQLQPILSSMRDQRPGFVQKKDQYAFCYKAIEFALNGESGNHKKKTKKNEKK